VVTPTFNVLSLCTGIGGLELGLKLACPKSRTVCYCEREAYCVEILVKRIEERILDNAPIWSDITTFDGRPWNKKVDCVVGGYPCQPFSSAGKKLGREDERWIWPHIAGIIAAVEPEWCFFENVSAHLRVGFEQVHDDLQKMGYRVAAGVFTAEEVGAGHRRERLFWLAHSIGKRRCGALAGIDAEMDTASCATEGEEPEVGGFAHASDDGRSDVEVVSKSFSGCEVELGFPPVPNSSKWREINIGIQPTEPFVCGVADGSSVKLDRLRCCGNAVVPLVAGYAFGFLKEVIKSNEKASRV